MMKYNQYIKDHLDVDPYNEEDWDDDQYLKKGDKVEFIEYDVPRYDFWYSSFTGNHIKPGTIGSVVTTHEMIEGQVVFVDFLIDCDIRGNWVYCKRLKKI